MIPDLIVLTDGLSGMCLEGQGKEARTHQLHSKYL